VYPALISTADSWIILPMELINYVMFALNDRLPLRSKCFFIIPDSINCRLSSPSDMKYFSDIRFAANNLDVVIPIEEYIIVK